MAEQEEARFRDLRRWTAPCVPAGRIVVVSVAMLGTKIGACSDDRRHCAYPSRPQMTRILITGGAGFIGSHLTDRLLERGDDVLVIDNFATARRDTLPTHDDLTLVEDTIADTELVDALFAEFEPEIVVHAAASYKDPDAWTEDARTNAVGTANVVHAAERAGVSRLVYFQTALCYGLHPQEQPITLSHPLDPRTRATRSRRRRASGTCALSELDWISLRLANVYGPRNLSGPLPTFFQRLTRASRSSSWTRGATSSSSTTSSPSR